MPRPARCPAITPPPALAGVCLLALLVLCWTSEGPASAEEPSPQASVLATVTPVSLSLELTLAASEVRVGERFAVEGRLLNHGAQRFRDIDITLHAIEEPCLRLRGPAEHHRGQLRGDDSISVRWLLEAVSAAPECRSVVVALSAAAFDTENDSPINVDSAARLLTVLPR